VRHVGLDLSLTGTGVVILGLDGEILFHGTYGESGHRDDPERVKIERQIGIASSVIRAIKAHGYDRDGWPDDLSPSEELARMRVAEKPEVWIEQYSFGKRFKGQKSGSNAQYELAELHGVVRSQLWLALGIAAEKRTASHVRKVVFGKGNTPKAQVPKLLAKGRVTTRTNWSGFEFPDGDQADAFVVAEALRCKDHKKQEGLF